MNNNSEYTSSLTALHALTALPWSHHSNFGSAGGPFPLFLFAASRAIQ